MPECQSQQAGPAEGVDLSGSTLCLLQQHTAAHRVSATRAAHAAQLAQLLIAESIVVVALQNGRLKRSLPESPVESIDYWIEVSLHDERQVVQGQTNPMVS